MGGFVVGSVWIEVFGSKFGQKRLELHDLSGSPQCLVHETFGLIGRGIEDGTDRSHAGGYAFGSVKV
jgi:hypothetical protein